MSFKKLGLVFFLLVAVVTRFYNLEETATFFWDPAYDLKQIYTYYQEKNLTLIGPISEEGNKVYGSLTYYMLMPFAVLGGFSTASTTYGAAVYGLLTVLLLLYLTYRVNQKMLLPVAFLSAIWFPLIETSRWAWNPHLVLFWIALGLVLFHFKKLPFLFAAGLAFGLTIHHHYLGVIATGLFVGLQSVIFIRSKKYHQVLSLLAGYAAAFAPFVAFDLTHPPGLFLTRILYFNQTAVDPTALGFLQKVFTNMATVFDHYTHSSGLSILFGGILLGLSVIDWKTTRSHLQYLLVWMTQVIGIAFINAANPHYFLPGLLFMVVYLIVPRTGSGKVLAYGAIGVLVLGSLLTIWPQIMTTTYTKTEWLPNIRTVDAITDTIETAIKQDQLQGVNLAVLGSMDNNLYGWKYRSLLEVRGLPIMTRYEYFTNSYLFVVSQTTEEKLRQDAAPEMERFRTGKLRASWAIPDSTWFVYLFSF